MLDGKALLQSELVTVCPGSPEQGLQLCLSIKLGPAPAWPGCAGEGNGCMLCRGAERALLIPLH